MTAHALQTLIANGGDTRRQLKAMVQCTLPGNRTQAHPIATFRLCAVLPHAPPCRPSCALPLSLPLPAKSWATVPIHKASLAAQHAAPNT